MIQMLEDNPMKGENIKSNREGISRYWKQGKIANKNETNVESDEEIWRLDRWKKASVQSHHALARIRGYQTRPSNQRGKIKANSNSPYELLECKQAKTC